MEQRWEKGFVGGFIENQIYKQLTDKNSYKGYVPRRSGILTFGAVVNTIGGLNGAAVILALFGGGEDTPVLLIIILCAVCKVESFLLKMA